jgi:hypothetical protein
MTVSIHEHESVEAAFENERELRWEANCNLSKLTETARRALEAWDTTCLHAPSDGMLQERMEALRFEIRQGN